MTAGERRERRREGDGIERKGELEEKGERERRGRDVKREGSGRAL